MNLGQIFETVLGWAGKELNLRFHTPIFDGVSLDPINEYMRKAKLPENGRCYLYDGETGERFHQPATVGYIYMLKLHHDADRRQVPRPPHPRGRAIPVATKDFEYNTAITLSHNSNKLLSLSNDLYETAKSTNNVKC